MNIYNCDACGYLGENCDLSNNIIINITNKNCKSEYYYAYYDSINKSIGIETNTGKTIHFVNGINNKNYEYSILSFGWYNCINEIYCNGTFFDEYTNEYYNMSCFEGCEENIKSSIYEYLFNIFE